MKDKQPRGKRKEGSSDENKDMKTGKDRKRKAGGCYRMMSRRKMERRRLKLCEGGKTGRLRGENNKGNW